MFRALDSLNQQLTDEVLALVAEYKEPPYMGTDQLPRSPDLAYKMGYRMALTQLRVAIASRLALK